MTSRNARKPAPAGLEVRPATMPLDQLAEYHQNPRKGDVDAIAESLEANGQYKPIVVNVGTLTGRPNEVLAGNHTLQAARRIGLAEIDVVLVDVDEDTATRIVVGDNRIFDLGGWERTRLVELIGTLAELDGTGVTERPPRPDPNRHDDDPHGIYLNRKWVVASTEAEWEAFCERLEAYADENGTLFGIIATLVEETEAREVAA